MGEGQCENTERINGAHKKEIGLSIMQARVFGEI